MIKIISFQQLVKAREDIRKYVYNTPLDFSMYLSREDARLFMKLECQQRLKSFKVRGAFNALLNLTDEQKRRGVAAISSGNHGAGVSYASSIIGGIKAKVFVPTTTPSPKVEKIKYYGAEVIQLGNNYDEAHKEAMDIIKKNDYAFVDPCSDIYTISGQGSIGMEILEANPDIDTIVAPIGGGGLITGLGIAAKHLKPGIKIIGVQTSACPAMVHSLRDNRYYEEYPSKDSICDALIGGVGKIPFEMASGCIDEILEVDEELIREALKLLITKEKIIAEPSSAVGISAFMAYPDRFKGKNTAVVITGGNLDTNIMKQILC